MMSFLDRAFCASKVKKHTCNRELTPELKKQAEKWWGGKDYPVAYGYFCGQPAPKESVSQLGAKDEQA